jgi:hypothetical protein
VFRIIFCGPLGTGGSCRTIEYRRKITEPGAKPLAVRRTTSTLAIMVTSVVVTDPPGTVDGRIDEVLSMDNTVMFTASGALSCQALIVPAGTAAQIGPAAAATMAAIEQNALSDLRNMR